MADKGTVNLTLNLSDEVGNDCAIPLKQLSGSPEKGSPTSIDEDVNFGGDALVNEGYEAGHAAQDENMEEHNDVADDAPVDDEGDAPVDDDNMNHLPVGDNSPELKHWKSGAIHSDDPTADENEDKNGNLQDGVEFKKSSPTKTSRFDRAYFFSKYLTFWWIQSLFTLGNKKVLGPDDLEGPSSCDKTDKLTEKFEREWYRAAYDADGNINEDASVMKVMFRVYGFKYFILGIPLIAMEALRLSQPIFLGLVTSYFAPYSKVSSRDAYLYGLGLILCTLFSGWHNVALGFMRQRFGMRIRIAITALVYRKVLRLSHKALASTTTGHIVNLVSVDVQRFDMAAIFLHYIWLGPLIVIASGYLIWREIGVSSLAGIGLLLLLVPLQLAMGRLLIKFRREIVSFTDKRVKVVNEIITGIRVIKMYAWEESFKKIVDALRVSEIRAIRKMAFLRATFMSFFFSSGALIGFVTFMTYVLTGNTLTAQKVFTCVSLFNLSRLIMTLFFPIAVTVMNEARVSIERLQNVLLLDEVHAPGFEKSNLRPKSGLSSVSVENLHASWTKDAKTLQNINLDVGEGELAAIVGPVGSGKSSLLMAILGELAPEQGSVNMVGKVAYVSQEAWIFNGTLKNNITFGQKLDEGKYQRVIETCALERDIKMLPQGDLTFVGERGVSLSGGQKARVSLARAVYFDADIYVLDDPLSAVDAHVGRYLFDQCICGFLANKVRILVTHQLQYLANANQILVLSEGNAVAKGTYSHLQDTGVDFLKLLNSSDEKEGEVDIDGNVQRFRTFSRLTSRVNQDIGESQIPSTESEHIGSDLSIASNVARVEEFVEKELPNEKKKEGSVTMKSYLNYFRSGSGVVAWSFLLLLFAFCQAVFIVTDWWLSYWTTQEEKLLGKDDRDRNLGIYAALVVALVILGITRALLFFFAVLQSSKALHGQMLRCILRVPLRFFDTNSIGRILNRFSKDISLVDDVFSFVFFDFIQTSLVVIGIILLICASNPIVFAFAAPIVVVFFILRRYYIKTTREVKRIEGLKIGLTSGQIGLILAYTNSLVGVFQQCVRQSTEVENHMTSVERVLEYTELEPEAPSETSIKPPDEWPQRGSIRFNKMTFAYDENLPNVLKGVTAHIRSNEKVGICGRTGAGKSSLLSTLFRTSEPKGEIIIDGINVLELGLKDLRSKLSIIPQDPVLFTGTMRRNLDPFTTYTDLELWNALEEVQLKEAVEALPGKLSSEMAESGQNLSVGQRQLVCLARAILKRNKILVIDEATANVDPNTDNLIQKTIREKFKDCTVLTIAHRLNTIMDSDRIMVLDAGRVKEFDEPFSLIRRKTSLLYQLVKQTGNVEALNLLDIAKKCYEAKQGEKRESDGQVSNEIVNGDGVYFDVSLEASGNNTPTIVIEQFADPSSTEKDAQFNVNNTAL
eukprot:gene20178-22153_t